MEKQITIPLNEVEIIDLKAGDRVLLNGVIYTARDAAHQRLMEYLDEGKELPIPIKNQIIYYVGPSPTPPGQIIGSAGPTSSYRMDAFTPRLLDLGLKGIIGKGSRNDLVCESIIKNQAIYFAAVGGIAALLAKTIKKSEIVAFEDLGTESIRKLEVKDMPLTVIIDSYGNNLYEQGPQNYLNSIQKK